jgi:hypothetical protein
VKPGLGRRSGAAAALVLAFLLALPATPAGAAAVITISSPGADAVLESSSVTVSGSADVKDALLNTLATVEHVKVTMGDKTLVDKDCPSGAKKCPFSASTPVPLNGAYQVVVTAQTAIDLDGTTATQTRKFAVEAPPAKPVLDTPTVNVDRSVSLSWSRNTEGDMLYYAAFRRDPGGTKFFQVGKITQPTSGAKVTFADTTTSGFGGGDYAYQVVAVRKGATAGSEKPSTPSATGAATVPVLATTTSSTVAAPPGTPGATTTTTAKPAPPAGVDLSKFLSSRAQPITLPSITIPEPPDTGFKGTLPFGARPPGDELEEGELEAVPPGDSGGRTTSIVSLSTGRPLVPIAGGLVLLLLALHMRLLNRRVKAAPAGRDLPVDPAPASPPAPPAPPAAPVAAAPTPPRRKPVPAAPLAPPPAATAGPALFDVDVEEGRDEDWAPAPETELEPEPEPDEVLTVLAGRDVAPEPDPEPEPDLLPADPDEIEVVEVVASTRRRLVRVGSD